ncbi:type II secretion system protein N [Inhella sp.]|uniref:type II secretion system protein N n=1 Tax=Inhella sp. TaxID=1921806 RepID=UPI0035AE5460
MTKRWVVIGLVCGLLIALIWQAPARWLSSWVAQGSEGRLQLVEPRGSLWRGSAGLVLSGGAGSRDASRLPGRLHWRLSWRSGPQLRLNLDCCSAGELALPLKPSWGRLRVELPQQQGPLLRLPAAWLNGLGTPWNTLQPSGQLRLSAQAAAFEYQGGRWQPQGQLDLELHQFGSRLSTLPSLGSYRLQLLAVPQGPVQLQLQTLEGALQLQGSGRLEGRLQFQGEARANPGQEAALNNLLNIIGRRQGERSVITIG